MKFSQRFSDVARFSRFTSFFYLLITIIVVEVMIASVPDPYFVQFTRDDGLDVDDVEKILVDLHRVEGLFFEGELRAVSPVEVDLKVNFYNPTFGIHEFMEEYRGELLKRSDEVTSAIADILSDWSTCTARGVIPSKLMLDFVSFDPLCGEWSRRYAATLKSKIVLEETRVSYRLDKKMNR